MRRAGLLGALMILLGGCETQPGTTTLLDERSEEVAEEDLVTAETRIGPPDSMVPVEVSFVVGRDRCDAVDQLVVRRSGGSESLVLVNATAERGDCQRSPDGNRGRPTLVRLDWHGWQGCKRMAASGDGFRVFPDGHIEAFMLQAAH